jgi:hypothetical protein
MVPCGHWTLLTVFGALGISGMLATMSIEAATSGAVFLAYFEQILLPELRRSRPDAVLVLDDLRSHKTAAVRRSPSWPGQCSETGYVDVD